MSKAKRSAPKRAAASTKRASPWRASVAPTRRALAATNQGSLTWRTGKRGIGTSATNQGSKFFRSVGSRCPLFHRTLVQLVDLTLLSSFASSTMQILSYGKNTWQSVEKVRLVDQSQSSFFVRFFFKFPFLLFLIRVYLFYYFVFAFQYVMPSRNQFHQMHVSKTFCSSCTEERLSIGLMSFPFIILFFCI